MTEKLLTPPAIPDKYDIIPIHASDIASFLRCRRYWDWSSPARNNLRRRVQLFGLNPNLWFGSGIHYALEQKYNPTLQRDPVEAFTTWFELQWNGGFIPTGSSLENETYDLSPNYRDDGCEVQGLRDLLPDPLEEEFMAFKDLGIGMMTFYQGYSEREDDFEVVAAETQFSIPLGFKSIDIREDSPNLGKKSEVHLRGKRDIVVYYPDRKDPRMQYGIVDHKTAAKVDEDYFLKLENDPQCTTYIVATVKEAEANGLPWTNVQDVLYNALRKAYPRRPTLTTRGFISLDRSKESTTSQLFAEAVREHGLIDWFHNDPKAQGYYEYLLEQGDKVFIQRDHATRNPAQIAAAFDELVMIAKEMLDPQVHIYKHPSGMPYCTRCQFRSPCLSKDDGSDWKGMLADGFELNRDR